MGLRINSNINVLSAINNLNVTDRNLRQSIQHLSTGLRINSGADDPSGLVISEQLKSQLSSINQAVMNSQGASDMISTADAALSGISNLLSTLQGSIEFALNSGGASSNQIAAQQNLVDQAANAIDRIANTTRFGSSSLLNGSNAYPVTGTLPVDGNGKLKLPDLKFRSITFANGIKTRSFTITVAQLPQRGEIRISGSDPALDTQIVASGDPTTRLATMRITGNLGTQDVTLASGTTTAAIAGAINAVAGFTGVIASAVDGGAAAPDTLTIYSADFGSTQNVRVQMIQGALAIRATTGAPVAAGGASTRADNTGLINTGLMSPAVKLLPGGVIFDVGKDGQVTMNGQTFVGTGVHFNINNPDSNFSFNLNRDGIVAATGGITSGTTAPFTVGNNNFSFQLGDQPTPTDQFALGIEGVMSSLLGEDKFRDFIAEATSGQTSFASPAAGTTINKGGYVSSLTTGNANSLTNSPKNALVIVQAATDQVSQLRAFLGAVVAYNIQPQIDHLNVSTQNIQSAKSDITDVNFAEETANFTKNNIIFQAGVQVLTASNTVSQSVLALLKGV